jgi:hypothetical protein
MVLVYLPSVLQRRFLLAYTVPLGILSVFGLEVIFSKWLDQHVVGWRKQVMDLTPLLLVAFSMIASILLSVSTAWNMSIRSQNFFDSAELVKAVDWLGAHAMIDDIVLSSEKTGQLVAASTGLPVFIGHPIETMDYQTKLLQIQEFYQGEIDPDWMYSNGVRWVVCGPYEKQQVSIEEFGSEMKMAYQNEDVVIYQLNP